MILTVLSQFLKNRRGDGLHGTLSPTLWHMKPDVSCILTTLLFGHPTKYFFTVLVPLEISIYLLYRVKLAGLYLANK